MIRIYGAYRSRATRVYWLTGELGIEVEVVPVLPAHRVPDPAAKDAPLNTRSSDYLKITPTGAVPAMDDDGFFLTESLAITLYLARKFGGPLAPDGPQEDALMQQWSFFGATWIEAHALVIMTRPDRMEAAADDLRRPLKVLDGHLAAHDYLVGDRFTVADINLAEILRYAQGHPTLIAAFPAVDRWLRTCQARPAFKAMWARRIAEEG